MGGHRRVAVAAPFSAAARHAAFEEGPAQVRHEGLGLGHIYELTLPGAGAVQQ